MSIGEKIKRLRTAKLMTQADLVGNEITRNMLSRIENGAANPSLETVYYIASRLNVPVGYLLSDENEEKIYTRAERSMSIKNAFMNENYMICRDMCMSADDPDDETQLILAECNLALGIELFNNGHLRECCEYFDAAIEACGSTIYRTDSIVAIAAVYFRYIRMISPAISSEVIDEDETNVYPSMTDEFSRYCLVMEQLVERGVSDGEIREVGREDSPYVSHLLARSLIGRGEYAEAYKHLYSVLMGSVSIPQPMLYFLFCDLEIACKETSDFKGAYEYSINKLELLQKLLG